MKPIWLVIIISVFITGSLSESAWADTRNKKPPIAAKNKLKIKSPQQAAQLVKRRTGGKILKVRPSGKNSYQVKVLKENGHIVSMSVDASSGRIKGR
ncbi:PepSY domain-containing protein [Thalassotalea sp. PLHSN55]|uniref:PepSY domain-containing protein n=1 Tax=Thalassotalea sp. PLHSN55 TaxID=3435888 RepID=UPI003F8679BA